jgi:hypothetical protein
MRTSRPASWAHRTRDHATRWRVWKLTPVVRRRARDGLQVGPRGCGRTRGCDFCLPSARGRRPRHLLQGRRPSLSRWETGPAPTLPLWKSQRHVRKYGPRAAGFARFCRFEIRAALRHRQRYADRKSSIWFWLGELVSIQIRKRVTV